MNVWKIVCATLVIFIVVVVVSLLLFLFDSILVWIFEWLFTSGG